MTMTGAPRRKGGSSAALVFFIIIAVVALVLAYFIYTDKEDWRKQHEELDGKHTLLAQEKAEADRTLEDWEKKVGLSLDGLKLELPEEDDTAEKLMRTERAKAVAAQSLADSVKTEREKVQKELENEQQALAEAAENHKKALEKVNSEFDEYRKLAVAEKEKLRKDLEDVRSQRQQALTEVRLTQAGMEELEALHRKEELAWEVDRTKLLMRLQDLRTVAKERSAGLVLSVDAQRRAATINRGRQDRVTPGMIFGVYSETPLGERTSKGRLEVRTVGELASVVALIDYDPRNPVVQGDYLLSPFVAVEHPKFVVAGWLGPQLEYGETEIRALIERWGGETEDEVAVDTDYLVMGEYMLPPTVIDEKALAAAKNGLDQLNTAKAFGVIILDVEKFLELVVR